MPFADILSIVENKIHNNVLETDLKQWHIYYITYALTILPNSKIKKNTFIGYFINQSSYKKYVTS